MRIILLLAIFLSVFSLFSSIILRPQIAYAQTPQPTPIILQKSETINHDYFGAGPMVDVEGVVNGDAYLAGGTVLMDGTVNGDVLAAGGQVTIKGSAHNVRVAGGQVLIDGKVEGNVTVVGGSVTVSSSSSISGSIVGAGGQMLLSGPIGKTANVAAGQITIGSAIGSDTSAMTGSLTLTPSAKINGKLWYQSPATAQIDTGASIIGKVTHTYPPKNEQKRVAPGAFLAGIGIFTSLAMLVLEIIIGLVLLSLVPNYSSRILLLIQTDPWLSLVIGILSWIALPFLFVILLITLLGIPLAILLVISIIIFSYIGRIFSALFVGNWIMERFNKKMQINLYGAFIAGVIVFEIISWIPLLGWIFVAVMSVLGLGAVLIAEKDYYSELRAKKVL